MNRIGLLTLALLSACGVAEPSRSLTYTAPFDPGMVDVADGLMDEIAGRWKLEPFRKERSEMQYLSQGKPAFFVALYADDAPVLVLTNVGTGVVLTLTVNDYRKMPPGDVERLADEVVSAFRSRHNVKLQREAAAPTSPG